MLHGGGRALLASILAALVSLGSTFCQHAFRPAMQCSRGIGKPTCGLPAKAHEGHSGHWFPESLFDELDSNLTDMDVRDLWWAISSPTLLRPAASSNGASLLLLEGEEASTVLCSDVAVAVEFLYQTESDSRHLRQWLVGKRHRLGNETFKMQNDDCFELDQVNTEHVHGGSMIASPPHVRLNPFHIEPCDDAGKHFEALIEYWLRFCPAALPSATSSAAFASAGDKRLSSQPPPHMRVRTQIHKGGRTVGECDFVLPDLTSLPHEERTEPSECRKGWPEVRKWWHIETSVKFFLSTAGVAAGDEDGQIPERMIAGSEQGGGVGGRAMEFRGGGVTAAGGERNGREGREEILFLGPHRRETMSDRVECAAR